LSATEHLCGADSTAKKGMRLLAARKMEIEHAVANCIAFGSKNSAIILRHH
jgi:hypothetical protein